MSRENDIFIMIEICKDLTKLAKSIASLKSDEVKKIFFEATSNKFEPRELLAYSEGVAEIVREVVSD